MGAQLRSRNVAAVVTVHRLDIEWIAMKAGIKPAVRVSIDPGRAVEVEVRARREGFAAVRGPHGVEFPGRSPSVILYLARDDAYARAVAEAEAPLLPPENVGLSLDEELILHARLGQMLGFPPCCVDEFGARLRRGITARLDGSYAHEDFVAAEAATRRSQAFLGRLNDLSADRRMRIITFYPCRYDCPQASTYAAAAFAAAVEVDAVAAADLRAALLGEMHIGVDGTRGLDAQARKNLAVEFVTF
jgi:hypothetical protein